MALRLAEPLSIWEIQDGAIIGHHGFYQGTYTGQIFKSMKPQDALYGDPQELQSFGLWPLASMASVSLKEITLAPVGLLPRWLQCPRHPEVSVSPWPRVPTWTTICGNSFTFFRMSAALPASSALAPRGDLPSGPHPRAVHSTPVTHCVPPP